MAEKSSEICAIEGFAAMPVKSYAHWAVTHVGIHAKLPDSSKQAHRDLSNYIIALERENDSLSSALFNLLAMYKMAADSGDCGNWDCETEEEVIAARAALDQSKRAEAGK